MGGDLPARRGEARRPEAGTPLLRDVQDLFERVMGGSVRAETLGAHLDMAESEGWIRLVARVPGATEEDLDVELDGDVMTIRGESRFQRGVEGARLPCVLQSQGTVSWTVRLPWTVEPDAVQASFEDGVLTLTLPPGGVSGRG